MLAAQLNGPLLRALQEGPKQQSDLRRDAGQPAQTTLRTQLKRLCKAAVVEKHRRNRFPGVLEYALSEAGSDLAPVLDALEGWLARSPDGSLELGGSPARAAVKALTEGWTTTMLRLLAAKPLTLTELDSVIGSHNYPSLERRLSAMRLTGLVAECEGDSRGTPYAVTTWARRSVAPLMAAARWERRHAPMKTAPVGKLDVETVFLLATGLLSAPEGATGSCRLAVELSNGKDPVLAGLLMAVCDGVVTARSTSLGGRSDAWASGSLSAWLKAIVERDPAGLELSGDGVLARSLVDNVHDALFAKQVPD